MRPPAVELAATPFFKQEDHFGGPAALAAVLARVDVRASPDQLANEIFLPGRDGPLSKELAASVGQHGRTPQVLPAKFDALLDNIARGHPVVVLQNTGYAFLPHWQYAVVVGYDLGRDVLVMRSGARARQEIGRREFTEAWQRAGGFAMIVLGPGEAPVAELDFKGR